MWRWVGWSAFGFRAVGGFAGWEVARVVAVARAEEEAGAFADQFEAFWDEDGEFEVRIGVVAGAVAEGAPDAVFGIVVEAVGAAGIAGGFRDAVGIEGAAGFVHDDEAAGIPELAGSAQVSPVAAFLGEVAAADEPVAPGFREDGGIAGLHGRAVVGGGLLGCGAGTEGRSGGGDENEGEARIHGWDVGEVGAALSVAICFSMASAAFAP